ncbi:bZIP transcription factor 17-like [Andrographis paniculata]|uniref:bZIP transcription factor 17-like n=1 Tax=Andrographis paniculata TaxID=175694 RepID=UPI0021E7E7C4|nr:bZIP transcription factor 17-like [Andrographis paniculata]
MSGEAAVAVHLPLEMPPPDGEFESALRVPSVDDGDGDCVLEELDFDFDFDDISLPSADVLDVLLNSTDPEPPDCLQFPEPRFSQFGANFGRLEGVIKSTSPELCDLSGDGDFSGDQSWDASGVLDSASPGMESHQISGYLNMPSPESNGSNRGSAENSDPNTKDLNCPSPESNGWGNSRSDASASSNNCAGRSVSSSPDSINRSIKQGVVDQKIKLEDSANNSGLSSLQKRKIEVEHLTNDNPVKCRKPSCSTENNHSSIDVDVHNEEDEKRKIRLMRNRESAQLSRQRKKHYVEELEDKVRSMHSTIQDLNMKISYVMAENATLRQQMGGGGGGSSGSAAAPAVPPPPMAAPPPPGVYPMMYPWMACPPPYMMKPQGSQVPLVPIPRLKTQSPAQAPKENKKVKSRKSEGTKTKKVAGVSFLGLLFFVMLFGGLVPMFNTRYGGVTEMFTTGVNDFSIGKHHGRVLMVNGTEFVEKPGSRRDYTNSSKGEPSADEFIRMGNGSEHLAASLYVPRNDRLVKIDGNLIIHSVLASEKSKASRRTEGSAETGLAFHGDLVPAIPGPDAGRNGGRHAHLRALGSSEKEGMKSKSTDGKLQQWFREGLAGPMLSAGMCTEVFQFDVSAASGAIIPAPVTRNISEKPNRNYTQLSKGKNRRFLHSIPLPDSSRNISSEPSSGSKDDNFSGSKNKSSMVVSVLFDPREAGDGDVDGVMGAKSLSRIFVVVLIENVRYATYSCMLPFKGIVSHLVTA